MKKIQWLIMGIALSGWFSACQDEDEATVTTSSGVAAIEEQVSLKFDELDIDITGILAEDEGGRVGAFGPNRLRDRCATITRDEVNRTMTIDFGSTGCTGSDGKVRTGKIIVTYIGTFREGNAMITHNFNNFTVDAAKIEGTRTIEYLGVNDEGYLMQEITLSGGKVTFEDRTVVTREANWTRTWVRGINPMFDEFWTEGTASGVIQMVRLTLLRSIPRLYGREVAWSKSFLFQ